MRTMELESAQIQQQTLNRDLHAQKPESSLKPQSTVRCYGNVLSQVRTGVSTHLVWVVEHDHLRHLSCSSCRENVSTRGLHVQLDTLWEDRAQHSSLNHGKINTTRERMSNNTSENDSKEYSAASCRSSCLCVRLGRCRPWVRLPAA